MKLRNLGRILGLFALVLQCAPLWSATIFDVEKIMATAPTETAQGPVAVLLDGPVTHHVRFDSLRTLAEAYRRIGSVARVHARLALAIDRLPNARAIPMAAGNVPPAGEMAFGLSQNYAQKKRVPVGTRDKNYGRNLRGQTLGISFRVQPS